MYNLNIGYGYSCWNFRETLVVVTVSGLTKPHSGKEETLPPILFIEEILEDSGWIDPKVGVTLPFGIEPLGPATASRIPAMAANCRRACVFRRCLRTSARWKYRTLSHLNGHLWVFVSVYKMRRRGLYLSKCAWRQLILHYNKECPGHKRTIQYENKWRENIQYWKGLWGKHFDPRASLHVAYILEEQVAMSQKWLEQ